MQKRHFHLAVIGAGPAGLSAALAATKAGLEVILLDDQPDVGGQVYRQLTRNCKMKQPYLGQSYFSGRNMVDEMQRFSGVYAPRTTVWQITAERDIAIVVDGKAEMLSADYILIATGAIERPMPVTGWTMPGVMSVGGAQTLLKTSALGAENAVFVGSGPLLYLTIWQYLQAGLPVRAVLDITRPAQWRSVIAYAPLTLFQPKLLISGWKWLREIRRQCAFIPHVSSVDIIGTDHATGIRYETEHGAKGEFTSDHIFLHQGVMPNINLTMATGLHHRWNDHAHYWQPVVDQNGQSSDPHIYVAGDGGGIGGAAAAALAGTNAARAIIAKLKPETGISLPGGLLSQLCRWRAKAIRPFLDRLYLPPADMRLPQRDDTVVCRCENVRKADIDAALSNAVTGPNQLKAFCRAGMGRCQGRSCGIMVQEMIAAHHKQSLSQTGYYRLRPPVKPLTLAELASLNGPWPV